MSSPLLLESIRLLDGKLSLLPYHQRRIDRSRRVHYAKCPAFKLDQILPTLDLPKTGEYKLRLLYGAKLEQWQVVPYTITPVRSLRVVVSDELRYGRKYADRAALNSLYRMRRGCDDVLIVQRGHLTDSSYANIALYDGSGWYTPAWPLLRGVRREYLLDRGTIRPSIIRLRDIGHFSHLRLINAMMDWDESPVLGVDAVRVDKPA